MRSLKNGRVMSSPILCVCSIERLILIILVHTDCYFLNHFQALGCNSFNISMEEQGVTKQSSVLKNNNICNSSFEVRFLLVTCLFNKHIRPVFSGWTTSSDVCHVFPSRPIRRRLWSATRGAVWPQNWSQPVRPRRLEPGWMAGWSFSSRPYK